jgi:hypothetical protein
MFIADFMDSMSQSGYNSATFVDDASVDHVFDSKEIFLFRSRDELKNMGMITRDRKLQTFLCHSSADKPIVDQVYDVLQKAEFSAWYDKYEIRPGDSITTRINEGLSSSHIGILVLSQNFISTAAAWARSEMGFFLQQRMADQTRKFLVINVDLDGSDIPALLRDYRYVKYDGGVGLEDLVRELRQIRREMERGF